MYKVLSIMYKILLILILTTFYLLHTTYVNAESISLGVYPPILQINSTPPAIIQAPISIENLGDSPQNLKIDLRPFTASDQENGQVKYLTDSEANFADPLFFQRVKILDPSAGSGQPNDCVSGFLDNYYKPFVATPSSQSVMTSNTGGANRKSQITYKINVSGAQAPGLYTNIVTYIASPGF